MHGLEHRPPAAPPLRRRPSRVPRARPHPGGFIPARNADRLNIAPRTSPPRRRPGDRGDRRLLEIARPIVGSPGGLGSPPAVGLAVPSSCAMLDSFARRQREPETVANVWSRNVSLSFVIPSAVSLDTGDRSTISCPHNSPASKCRCLTAGANQSPGAPSGAPYLFRLRLGSSAECA